MISFTYSNYLNKKNSLKGNKPLILMPFKLRGTKIIRNKQGKSQQNSSWAYHRCLRKNRECTTQFPKHLKWQIDRILKVDTVNDDTTESC